MREKQITPASGGLVKKGVINLGRLEDKWKETKKYLPILSGENKEFKQLFDERTKKIRENDDKNHSFLLSVMNHCQEIIYTEEDGIKCFDLVIRSLNTETLEILVESGLQLTSLDDPEEFKYIIAIAMLEEVPLFGNTPELHAELEEIQKDIIKNGFVAKIDGESKRIAIKRYKSVDSKNGRDLLSELSSSHVLTPGEIKIINEKISSEFQQYTNAENLINYLGQTIVRFEEILKMSVRNENELQNFITENPILFGTEYRRIIPKHLLGSEFEMDYALERFNGVYDLVEIESSNLVLYTKEGNPRKELTHAEQQVLDWQEWLEEKNFYAREKLKDIRSPRGYVIIGRDIKMSVEEKKKLARRNLSFNEKLCILTYDDLLEKAKALLSRLVI